MEERLQEDLIRAWIDLTSVVKNNRIFDKISYNEAVLLHFVYDARQRGEGVYLKDLLKRTRMLKSLLNRTMNALLDKGFVTKTQEGVQCVLWFNDEKEEEYSRIHRYTLAFIRPIVEALGEEDVAGFIRISRKIADVL